MGEQERFAHVDDIVRDFVVALPSAIPRASVTVLVNPDRATDIETADGAGPVGRASDVVIHVVHPDGAGSEIQTELHFREVFWADLDTPSTLLEQVKFWFWAASSPGIRPPTGVRSGRGSGVRIPETGRTRRSLRSKLLWLVDRMRLFGVTVLGLIAPVFVMAIGKILQRWFGVKFLAPNLIAEYVGDVRLYATDGTPSWLPLQFAGEPPRTAIRRRMIRGLVDMALAAKEHGYERWYVLAHSLGTVVAHNGLMELDTFLPNYLDRGRFVAATSHFRTSKHPSDPYRMMPHRPPWVGADDAIDRAQLFASLRAFVTYGSPLDKFAVLFPTSLFINEDAAAIGGANQEFEWINVYDPLDPVAAQLDFFSAAKSAADFAPQNFAYRSAPVVALAHTSYLTPSRPYSSSFSATLLRWMFDGQGSFTVPNIAGRWITVEPEGTLRACFTYFQIAGLGILGTYLSAAILHWLLPNEWPTKTIEFLAGVWPVLGMFGDWVKDAAARTGDPIVNGTIALFGLAIVLVVTSSIVRYIVGWLRERR
jgi:hypothetical protein